LLLVAAIVAALIARRRLSADAIFFALWLVPAALVYVTIHIGDPGYLMSMLPGLFVAVAALIGPLARVAPRAVTTFAALLVALNVGVFVLADTPFSAGAIARHDRSVETRVASVSRIFPPSSTVILAQSQYLIARYYLPHHRVLFYGAEPEVLSRAAREVRMTAPTTVVLFGTVSGLLPPGVQPGGEFDMHTFALERGASLVAYDLEPR
jgi:hypothetical protein